ncbi:MAG: hypothetical protein A3G18_09365 [Rhodospirillales bacterium RIFCSPLOWO2_12_FULL_58_28]|nr:MAG: hypothetical protein A3H92_02305 [Rhodospirillales bacterium RIFCSPLOWO2_02_FULL_58_16]OHC76713.1 MAG: hypothetical protein A3G18_09365 [Rhodospirillales bacterium RIFCSPLOWO2_12_FULL_58_28]
MTKKDSKASLSIVVPAYNEEELIAHTVEHLLATAPQWVDDLEVIVVNDGSSDSTGRIVDELANKYKNVIGIQQKKNGGFGITVRTGLMRATKTYVMICPADYRFTLEDFNVYLVLIRYADIVIGYRRHRRLQLPFYGKMVSAIYHQLVNLVFNLNFFDVNWIHMYKRDQIETYLGKSDGVFLLAENIIRAKRLGLRIVGVDVNYTERESGIPTGVQPRTILKTIRELFIFFFNRR